MDDKAVKRAFHFLCLGTLLIVFCEATHIPAYPKMLEHFQLGAGYAVYMQLGFALGLTGFQPLMGWMGDSFGQKRVIVFGALLMAIGSLLVALSPAFWVMVVGLFFKGMAGAAVVPAGVAFAGRYFQGDKIGKALGLFGFYSVLGALVAPLLSGIFVDSMGWSSIFWLCTLLGLLASLLFIIGVPLVQGEKAAAFDFLGAILVLGILGSLLTVPTFINEYGFESMKWLPSAIIFVIAFVLLIVVEKKQKAPLIDIEYAMTRNFWVPSLIAIFMFITFSSVMFVLTFFIQNVQEKSSTTVGLLLMPLYLVMGVANLWSGRLMEKLSARVIMTASVASMVGGAGMLIFTNKETSVAYLLVSMMLIGLGIGMIGPVIRAVVVSKADQARIGVVTFTYLTIENLASRVGASFAIVMFALFTAGGSAVGALSNTAMVLTTLSAIAFLFIFLVPKRVRGIQGVGQDTEGAEVDRMIVDTANVDTANL